jgi:hypothetical protein
VNLLAWIAASTRATPEADDNDELRELPYTHCFHKECVAKWLKISALCPLCKAEIASSSRTSDTRHSDMAPVQEIDNSHSWRCPSACIKLKHLIYMDCNYVHVPIFVPFILERSTTPLVVDTLQCNAILFLFGVPVNLDKWWARPRC